MPMAPLPAAILLVEDLDDHAILHLDCEEAIESIAGEAPE